MSNIWLPDPEDNRAVRELAGVFDRSERGKLALSGPDAAALLDGLLSNDVAALEDGEGCWSTLLTAKGRMLAEVRVLRCGEEYSLDCERISLQALWDALWNMQIGHRVALHKRTLQRGMLAVLGPRADEIAGCDPGAAEGRHLAGSLGGVAVRAIRTPFGLDLIADSDHNASLARALAAAGARTIGEAAVECLRVEAGRPRFGVDMDETTMPQEAGIHTRTVSYSKGCYVGQETVARLHWKGKPNRHLRLLECSAQLAPGTALEFNGAEVGRVSSSVLSPSRGALALALLRREVQPGSRVSARGVAGAGALVREAEAIHMPTGA